jgi:gas vesicle protein
MGHDNGHSTGTVLLSFLLGGIVGAGVALLLAPQSGTETRRRIRELAEDTKDRAGDAIDQIKDKVSSTLHSGKEYIDDKKAIIAAAIEAGKEAYEKEKEKHAKG